MSLKCIPPEYRSLAENLFPAVLVYDSDHKKYVNRVVFCKLSLKFNHLATEVILVGSKTKEHCVYIMLSVLEGDNLGLNINSRL